MSTVYVNHHWVQKLKRRRIWSPIGISIKILKAGTNLKKVIENLGMDPTEQFWIAKRVKDVCGLTPNRTNLTDGNMKANISFWQPSIPLVQFSNTPKAVFCARKITFMSKIPRRSGDKVWRWTEKWSNWGQWFREMFMTFVFINCASIMLVVRKWCRITLKSLVLKN